jgi:hypothetical protein
MEAKEFIIKKFELNNPELVKVIEEWTEHSIKMNWDEVRILLNGNNVPNYPIEDEFNEKGERKTWVFLNKTSQNIGDYLMAKGFTHIIHYSSGYLQASDGQYYSGHIIYASMYKSEKAK